MTVITWFLTPLGPYGYSPLVWLVGFVVAVLLAMALSRIGAKKG